MQRSKAKNASPSPEELVERLFSELLAVAAGVDTNKHSFEELQEIAITKRHPYRRDALYSYFKTLDPYEHFGDCQGRKSLPRPRPLELHIERSILYARFRFWLRKQGIEPDAIDAGEDYWSADDTDVYQSHRSITNT